MEIKKGDEFLAIETGTVYTVFAVSKYGSEVLFSIYGPNGMVINTIPNRVEMIKKLVKEKMWVPNTPAGMALYGFK